MDHNIVETVIKIALEEMDAVCSEPKMDRTSQSVIRNKVKSQARGLLICDGGLNTEKGKHTSSIFSTLGPLEKRPLPV